ncbi:MAG: hypothetical protein M2R46_05621 [Verrucomicrobia subdivision 3 bacterium]|nr:hypothetical protein [Limisphaerales bacterium]
MRLRQNCGLLIFVFTKNVKGSDQILPYEMEGTEDYFSLDVTSQELAVRLRVGIARSRCRLGTAIRAIV